MAVDEELAVRIRAVLADTANVAEIKMMGSLIFTVRGHMCCGSSVDGLMVRVGADAQPQALNETHVEALNIGGGRQPRGFVRVRPAGCASERELRAWIARGLDFVATLPDKKPR